MRIGFCFLMCFLCYDSVAQKNPGLILGYALNEKKSALDGATITLISLEDTSRVRSMMTGSDGAFQFSNLPFGYYQLNFSYVGLLPLKIDSIHFRINRYDFNLNDVILQTASDTRLNEIIIYAEKPMIQSRDGNITFNAGESALSAGSNASDLLANVPLITKDPSGKLLVRGKEPKILIDDKPVELNLQQLQDLLESMPGSSIEKIEVMTNPPPQYASEQGGVINIITKKGAVGMNGRLSIYAGTRGEGGMNGSFNYRKQGFSVNINTGTGYNYFEGEGYSNRQNTYSDSSNSFHTESQYKNKSMRPNLRANINYDVTKFHSLNLVLQYNQNDFHNSNYTIYTNRNRFHEVYKLSSRSITSNGMNYNPNVTLSYTLKTKKPGESFKFITSFNNSLSRNTRNFYQQFFNTDLTPNGIDSTQQQLNGNNTNGFTARFHYDLPLANKKTFLSVGSYYNNSVSEINTGAAYQRSSDNTWVNMDLLTNEFIFSQYIINLRGSFKQIMSPNLSTTIGLNAEKTGIGFDLISNGTDTANVYWNFLPFATVNKIWKDILNLTFSYRRTVRRPGLFELNPTIDFSDPYNLRFGQPALRASAADNFDLVVGKTKNSFYANLGLGYNIVKDIFAQVRTLMADGKTQMTWQNISGRKEYEFSTWSGYTVTKNIKVNVSASYAYNEYSSFDKDVRKYRNGGSLSSNINASYSIRDLYLLTGNFTWNRFANPQGTVRSTVSMNIGLQAKLFKKKLTATINIIDPFLQQVNKTLTYGTNFVHESFNATQTRNYRLSLGYAFIKNQGKKQSAGNLLKLQKATFPVAPKVH